MERGRFGEGTMCPCRLVIDPGLLMLCSGTPSHAISLHFNRYARPWGRRNKKKLKEKGNGLKEICHHGLGTICKPIGSLVHKVVIN